jgi:hypothetical protein
MKIINGREMAGRTIALEGVVVALGRIVLNLVPQDQRGAAVKAITEAVAEAAGDDRWQVVGHEEAATHAEAHTNEIVAAIAAALKG